MGLKQAIGSGNRTLDPQKRSCVRPGIWTLDRLKRSFVRSCTRSRNTIAQTIANAIARAIVKITCVQMHERLPYGTCPLDDGQRPDRLKNGQRTDRFKNDESSEKIMFLAEHIFFEVPHHVPIFVHFYRLNQPIARTCRIHTTKCSSCTFTW